MQKNELTKRKAAKRNRLGRGGKRGKTAGRGHKGQRQHGGHGVRPEMRDMIKKFPKLRGRGVNSNKSFRVKPRGINLATISENYKDGEKVTPRSVLAKKLVRKVSGQIPPIKILGTGDLKVKVSVLGCVVSAVAKEKIEKAGGKVILK
jgi:large subunit ribosomal protein L15